ncbi:hypothetical protein HY440_03745 [Candidatus Microgenomates bacterium]|nr:hypothetical protein [Candidatus Microgenomates bacterium]
MQPNLVPISQIAKAAQTDKIHLAYLTKLRLLPQTIRRKVSGKIQGCYPDSVVAMIRRIENLKDQGLTYSQIRFQLAQPEPAVEKLSPLPAYLPVASQTSPLALLIVGLLLGYLLAVSKPPTALPAAALAQAGVSPLDENSKVMVKVLTNSEPLAERLYVIAVPSQNFYKMGQTNINDLVKTQ